MKGLSIDKAGGDYVLTDLSKPTPGPKQVLVKSLYAGINPVDTFMQAYGQLVESWPIVIGCDASGAVVEVGEGVTKFKQGDMVFGCTRLGVPGHGTFQEYFLMDEEITFRTPGNVSAEGAASLGVGTLTACLGLVTGLGLKLPEKGESPKFDQWVIVLGGSGSVGQYAVQIAKICGYKVLASCSSANETLVKSFGADATLNYKLDLPTQVTEVEKITGGHIFGVCDTSAASGQAALEFLSQASKNSAKLFSTVDDWTQLDIPSTIKAYRIRLGQIGKSSPGADIITNACAAFIPYLETYLAEGTLKPNAVEVAGVDLEAVKPALELQNKGAKGGKKIVVKIQDV